LKTIPKLIIYYVCVVEFLFQLLGLSIFAIGVWAWTEKDALRNFSKVTNIVLDPAFIFIIIGCITFIIGFTGCVGALRENTCLLATYAMLLAVILLLEMSVGILAFVFKDWVSFYELKVAI
ncbi:tetraspanin-5-like, partial [Diaphorina citri]|uniref:Tetraspanin-5-like n=1 Tax=Diaphorina citri TaxID=121845 RepID=A0A1S3DRU6_DIACI